MEIITIIWVIIIILVFSPMLIEAVRSKENETYLYQPQDVEESELLVKAKESLERCEKFWQMFESRETQKIIDEITDSLKSSGKAEVNVYGEERAKTIGDYFANKGFNCSYEYTNFSGVGMHQYTIKISPIGGPANRKLVENGLSISII